MTAPALDVERDAIELAHTVYTGDFHTYADILEHYTDDQTPAGQLIFQLAFLIKKAVFSNVGLYETTGFYNHIKDGLDQR